MYSNSACAAKEADRQDKLCPLRLLNYYCDSVPCALQARSGEELMQNRKGGGRQSTLPSKATAGVDSACLARPTDEYMSTCEVERRVCSNREYWNIFTSEAQLATTELLDSRRSRAVRRGWRSRRRMQARHRTTDHVASIRSATAGDVRLMHAQANGCE
ncbi:hypothetical protein FGB62_491g00 [Gracilaria domingensis]|nr:hypothetical protein FGB62_491g00 [Gracilaria domingensis]